MKLLISLFLLCVAPIFGNAKTETDARRVLDKTAAIVGNKNGATAEFTVSGGKIGSISGTISIKGNKFCARTPKATVWFDGKTQWSYMPTVNEVNVSHPSEAQLAAMNPYTFINMYKSGYRLSMKRVGAEYQVHMVAEKAGRSIPELYVTVSAATYKPRQVRMKRGGEWTTVAVRNLLQKRLPDAVFVFNSKDFPTAEVIDLR